LKVFDQALTNHQFYNYSYIGVPEFNDWSIQRRLCTDYGIGLLIYDSKKGYNDVREIVQPKFTRYKGSKIIERLTGYNKLSKPGARSGDGNKVTAFRVTLENIINYVRHHPGCTIKEMTEAISHHYNCNKAACNNVYGWIYKGVITDVIYRDRKLFLSKDAEEHKN
jgi:hypothetical protein